MASYTVQEGDTLGGIAQAFDTTVDANPWEVKMTDQQNALDGIVTGPTDIGEEMQDEIAELGDAAIGALQEALLEASPEEKRILMRRVGALQERLAYAEGGLQELAPAPRRSKIAIAGIERTQAVQYFLFNGQGSGFAADNTVPLVANKSMILRVYVDRSKNRRRRYCSQLCTDRAAQAAYRGRRRGTRNASADGRD